MNRKDSAAAKKNRLNAKSVFKSETGLLFALFAVMWLTHTALAHAVFKFPTALIDEMLYGNIARSIAEGKGILYMGQPAEYTYILYPLIIAPVYGIFGAGADFFRIIQCVNAFWMSLSVFPLYALAKSVTGDQKKSLLVCGFLMVMPDTFLCGYVLCESLIYPLFFTAFYLTDRYVRERKIGTAALAGAVCGLLYVTKPGSFVPVIGFGLVCVFSAVKDKKRIAFGDLAVCAGAFALVLGANLLVTRYLLGLESAQLLSAYANKIGVTGEEALTGETLGKFGKGVLLSAVYLVTAGGVGGTVLGILRVKDAGEGTKRLGLAVLVSLIITLVGTAWTINRTDTHFSVHLRYFAMYLPLLFAFAVTDAREPAGKNKVKKAGTVFVPAAVILGICALCAVIFGAKGGLAGEISVISSLSVNALRILPDIAATIAAVALCGLFGYLIYKGNIKTLRKVTVIAAFAVAVVGSAANCRLTNFVAFSVAKGDVAEALEAVGTKEALVITQDYEPFFVKSTLFDTNSKQSRVIISQNDFFNTLSENDGVYRPIVPERYGLMRYTSETPDVEYLVFDYETPKYIQFSAETELLTRQGSLMAVVRIPRGGVMADSVMGSLMGSALYNNTGYIRVFRTGFASATLTLRLEADRRGTMTLNCDGMTRETELLPGNYEYTFELPVSSIGAIVFECPGVTVNVNGYEIEYR